MGRYQVSYPASNNSLYPQQLQIKIYQAFIFSIPILFSVILFLLFYLFYLKRRASDLSSPSPQLPITMTNSNQDSTFTTAELNVDINEDLKDKLQTVLFGEELRAKDSQCCVCLGEFEMKKDVEQVVYCKHVFHPKCIRDWLQKNATCPLCRCQVIAPAVQQPCHQESISGTS